MAMPIWDIKNSYENYYTKIYILFKAIIIYMFSSIFKINSIKRKSFFIYRIEL
jgi:hypothetical protein